MARNGNKIFDADTHVGPSMDILEQYLSSEQRAAFEPFADQRRVNETTGQVSFTIGARSYRRRLGSAVEGMGQGYLSGFTGSHKGREPDPDIDRDAAKRIADLEIEGIDVNLLLPSGWFGCWTAVDDPELELLAYGAYNRWMADYCSAYPERLGGVVLLSARNVDASVAEIRRCANERWAWAVFPYVPAGMPLDHPALEPLWAAAAEYDFSIVLHTFTAMPPYAPGGLDTWDNLFIQRSAAHPWCGMRNMASLIGSGVLDRYSGLRMGVLEAGHGWLPHWMQRLDEHAHSAAASLPALKHLPGEYVRSGRYFQSIEIPEGGPLTNVVADFVGDDVLMFSTDYPHGESWFPKAVDAVEAWEMPDARRSKLYWDNAVRFYARCGLQAS